jgi:hypothetical protein
MAGKLSLKIYPYEQKKTEYWFDSQKYKNVSLMAIDFNKFELKQTYDKLLEMGYVWVHSKMFLKEKLSLGDLLKEQRKLNEKFNIILFMD